MFTKIAGALSSFYSTLRGKFASLLGRTSIDATTRAELEKILIEADTGSSTTQHILDQLQKKAAATHEKVELKKLLHEILCEMLSQKKYTGDSEVILLVGINGSGKTTTAAKLAAHFQKQNKSVLLVAADTFRAAAQEQLSTWAQRLSVPLITGGAQQDPASVVFAGCTAFKEQHADVMIIDTAGRLQTKIPLMKELEKIRRILQKQLPDATITTLLTLDSMLGQNSLDQALLFHESTPLSGIILTKTDGTGKGGITFAISHTLPIPIAYTTFGEQSDDIQRFDATMFVSQLLES